MNRRANPRVGATSTDVSGHRFIDLVVSRFGMNRQKRRGAHDLPGLAVAALRDVELAPGLLKRVIPGF